MILQTQVSLKDKATFHIGGIAKNYYIPETEDELQSLICTLAEQKETFKILSGGSNLLINDKKVFENVIYMGQLAPELTYKGQGRFYVGASNRIQSVIHFVNEYGYGGFEELFGLPALFGGILYMNAGIGGKRSVRFMISDFVERVKVMEAATGRIVWLENSECNFGYRRSAFQANQYVILGADIALAQQDKQISEQRIQQRLQYCRQNQEYGKGCFGTCFSTANGKILKLIDLLNVCRRGVFQSRHNANWLVNDGKGTYAAAMRLIGLCRLLHKLTFQKIECEVRIWD